MEGAVITLPGLGSFKISSLTLNVDGTMMISVDGRAESTTNGETRSSYHKGKLQVADVKAIRKSWSDLDSHDTESRRKFEKTMAKRYNTSPTNIDHIVMRRTWKYVR